MQTQLLGSRRGEDLLLIGALNLLEVA